MISAQRIDLQANVKSAHQVIDGFGVNINAKYFEPRLLPAMDLLVNDLKATLYRVDIWGKSNWIDPDGTLGKQTALSPQNFAKVYRTETFQRGWAMMRYLNQHGIQPYLTASGVVPAWMSAGDDRNTLTDFESFTEMLASLVEWAIREENLQFTLFGPLNETDLGSPEGPLVDPQTYARVCEMLDEKLTARGLDQIRLVVPEASGFNDQYLRALVSSKKLLERIGVFSLHDYSDISPESYAQVTGVVKHSPYRAKRLWMGEFGDLEQTGEREWTTAVWIFSRLLDHLQAGFNASLVWDAYDNYHDHDEYWTIYGILRTGLRAHTPKKRYHALKQVYRFVPPGWQRVELLSSNPAVRAAAFTNPERTHLTVAGMHTSASRPAILNLSAAGLAEETLRGKVTYYRTSAAENCHTIAHIPMCGGNYPFVGIEAVLPPDCIFTFTTLT